MECGTIRRHLPVSVIRAFVTRYRSNPRLRRNLGTFLALLAFVGVIVAVYAGVFQMLMRREGVAPSWLTGVYWTMQTMSTLGYGDLTFRTDLGRMFSLVVLVTGMVFLFVLLPFTLIQLLYAPWLEARSAARTPRELPAGTSGHVILTAHGPVEEALIERLRQFDVPYVVLMPDVARALVLHDRGIPVMVGRTDDPETYRRARVERAALVAATLSDTANANVVLSVREASSRVPIVATAAWEASVDMLKAAGCEEVVQLGEWLGREIARRISGHGGRAHIVGRLDDLCIAEAAAANTAMVGRTVRDTRLREQFDVNVVGLIERGRYAGASAGTLITEDTVLLLSGTQAALAAYDRDVSRATHAPGFALIIGGGRVGRAASRGLAQDGVDHRIVERAVERVRDQSRYVIGDATDPEVLREAGLDRAASVAVTTHDDDVNVYLTLYSRRLRPDVQILSRVTLEHNASTLRRAGADVVLSYIPMEANAIFDVLRHGNLLLLAQGLDVFTVPVPRLLVGKTVAASGLRADSGVNVLAIRRAGGTAAPPDINRPLEDGSQLILIGDRSAERAFFAQYA